MGTGEGASEVSVPAVKTAANSFIPAEWAPQKAIWTGWPSHGDLWLEDLNPARNEVTALVHALAEGGEKIKVLVMGDEAMQSAKIAITGVAELVPGKFGDIWFRDTGPIFTSEGRALRFQNNGWGGKYELPFDDTVGDEIAKNEGAPLERFDFILEGGAIEQDGEGTILTTRQCLLNPNRNKGWTQETAEEKLKTAFGAKKILWLDEGLMNDHTDGHIDNIARFVAPGVVLCQKATGDDDPNAGLYDEIANSLAQMTDAQGRKLKILPVPSPGRIENEDGDAVPASHMNFIIGNKAVVLPIYGKAGVEETVSVLQDIFPKRKIIALPSNALLSGGGSFHCITQQVPA